MPLNPEQEEKVRDFFRLNGVVPDCPYCGTGGWTAGDTVDLKTEQEGRTARMVGFACDNCGHVAMFDAERMGL